MVAQFPSAVAVLSPVITSNNHQHAITTTKLLFTDYASWSPNSTYLYLHFYIFYIFQRCHGWDQMFSLRRPLPRHQKAQIPLGTCSPPGIDHKYHHPPLRCWSIQSLTSVFSASRKRDGVMNSQPRWAKHFGICKIPQQMTHLGDVRWPTMSTTHSATPGWSRSEPGRDRGRELSRSRSRLRDVGR